MQVKADNIGYEKSQADYIVRFDLSWENAWKNEINCDGVYVFIKYKNKDQYGYHSAKIAVLSEGQFDGTDKTPMGVDIASARLKTGVYVPDMGLGLFVYPMEACSKGRVELTGIKIPVRMSGAIEDVKVFAIEMVYIPEGSFELGEAAASKEEAVPSQNSFFTVGNNGSYQIQDEEPIAFGNEEGKLFCRLDTPMGLQGEQAFIIPAGFPKGYRSMWYMKYPLTEYQFVQFINCLTRKQQAAHVTADISGERIEHFYAMTDSETEEERCAVYCRRDGNKIDAPVKFYSYASERGMNVISFDDVLAFACFSGLRPISEMEFEKAARGPLPAVPNEFAWGTQVIGRVFHFDGVDGSGGERPVPMNDWELCNCNYGADSAKFGDNKFKSESGTGWGGPVSAGVFENTPVLDGHSRRECIGAGYYGVMELTGNLWEFLITVGNPAGRAFRPVHGTGELDVDGHSMVTDWPDYQTAVGGGVRGGAFLSPSPARFFMTARSFASHPKADKRYHGGIRVGF